MTFKKSSWALKSMCHDGLKSDVAGANSPRRLADPPSLPDSGPPGWSGAVSLGARQKFAESTLKPEMPDSKWGTGTRQWWDIRK